MKIYLARHGQTAWNAEQRWQGTTDIPLNEDGLAQAAKLAEKMTIYPIQKIYSSPLQRAAVTAQAVAGKFGLSIAYEKELEEIRLGEWEGHTTVEVLAKYGEKFAIWEENHDVQIGLGVESNYELQQRAWAAFDAICKKETTDTLIVSHGAWINRLLCKLLHIPLQHRMSFHMSNVGLSIVNCQKDGDLRKYTVVTVNDESHLAGT
ncbi:MAG: histidine phosphatase family protein [Firmicutes bacterium]|nr:histidine phosphatase family protein [Bacillota bacterium]